MFSSPPPPPAAVASATRTTSRFRMSLQLLGVKPVVAACSRLCYSLRHEIGFQHFLKINTPKFQSHSEIQRNRNNGLLILSCSNSDNSTAIDTAPTPTAVVPLPSPVVKKRKRYRKLYPGESEGIVQEMRFVAMRLRNNKGKPIPTVGEEEQEEENDGSNKESEEELEEEEGTWQPSMEGFLNFLVDSKLVFDTLDRIVEASDNVAFAYFRKTGLERSDCLSKDLEWFAQQDIVIPEPGPPGVSYAKYLRALAERSGPLFLCHFYNVYFAHIAGGQVIAKQASEKILEGRELDFYKWNGDEEEMLKNVRENLNKLGENWTRDEKNRCLKEAKKSFNFLGQITRLIIL